MVLSPLVTAMNGLPDFVRIIQRGCLWIWQFYMFNCLLRWYILFWMFSFRYRAYFRTYKTLGRADKLNTAIFKTRVDVHLCSNAVCVIVNWTPHISNAKKGELYIKSKYYMNTFIVRKKGYRSNRSGCFRTQLHVKLTRCYICQTDR